MLSVSLNDSNAVKDKYKLQEKIINKLSSICKYHSGNKELLICVDCGMAICDQCGSKHGTHQKLYKTELINSGKELKKKSEEINNVLLECGFSEKRGNSESCKEEKQKIQMNIDNFQKMVDEIKKTSRNLNNTFNKTYDDVYPYIFDYKEKIRKLNDKSLQIQTMKNEKDFIEYYFGYTELKRKEKKIIEYLSKIRVQVESYKEVLKEFYAKTNSILEKIRDDYNMLINLQFHEDMDQLGKSSFYRKTVDRTLGSVTTKYLRSDDGKMNLLTMLDPRAKNSLINKEKRQYRDRIISKKLEVSKVNDENSKNDDTNLNLVFGIEPNTKNIFVFDKRTHSISKINLNFAGLSIDRLANNFSTLNYMGRFYLSGGYNQGFYKLNLGEKSLKELQKMPSRHNYHGMIDLGNNIFVVSGYNNPNVEKYDLSTNSWNKLQPLENSFSWPGCLSIEDRFLYIFGGLCGNGNTNNKKIYKMDAMNPVGNWEILDIVSNLEKIPFYSGIVQIGQKNILVLGGKFSTIEGLVNKCFNFNLENNTFNEENEYNLTDKEIFNGKRFCDLGGGLFGEFSCSSYNKFYLLNTSSKTIDIIQ